MVELNLAVASSGRNFPQEGMFSAVHANARGSLSRLHAESFAMPTRNRRLPAAFGRSDRICPDVPGRRMAEENTKASG